jgi:tRNA-specific 2-thiouridylase
LFQDSDYNKYKGESLSQHPPLDIDTGELNNYHTDKLRILVGVTGSIDSCVAAFLLKKQGFQVTALAINSWEKGRSDLKNITPPRCHIEDLHKLKNFFESLDIPFYATDIKDQYKENILETVVGEKLTGRANSSCLACTHLRFQTMFEKMKLLRCHYIATGNYAKTFKNHQTNEYYIHSSNDIKNDQSYFIAGLDQKILRKLLFPLAELKKDEVDRIANNFSLSLRPTNKRENICFDDDENFPELIKKMVPESLREPGQVLESKTEHYLTDQKGFFYFRVGQKQLKFDKGNNSVERNMSVIDFKYTNKAMYVGLEEENKYRGCQIVNVGFTSEVDKTKPLKVFVRRKLKTYYQEATLFYKNNNTLYMEFAEPVSFLEENEKLVFYEKDGKSSRILGYGHVATKGEYIPLDRAEDFRSHNKQDEYDDEDRSIEELRF